MQGDHTASVIKSNPNGFLDLPPTPAYSHTPHALKETKREVNLGGGRLYAYRRIPPA